MAEQPIVQIQAQRYILKYLRKNLHPEYQRGTRWGCELSRYIAGRLLLRVTVPDEDLNAEVRGPIMLLSVTGDGLPHLSPALHADIIRMVHEYYRHDFYLTVDQLHMGAVPVSLRDAIDFFRSEYGITEDDYPLVNSIRAYQRYRKKHHRIGPRGRPPRSSHLRKIKS